MKNSITAEFELKRADGSLVDSSEHSGNLNYIEGLGMMVAGIEEALSGMKDGEEFDITLSPEKMYGEKDETNVIEVSASDFHGSADELKEGMIIEAHTEQGHKVMTVKSIEGEKVVLDANHPLAGETLTFKGKVINSRPATTEEIEALTHKGCGCGGHGEGCGGHDHEEGHECCGGHGDGEGCGCNH